MDERLERALEFGNYRRTLSNQKKNVISRMKVLQTVHHNTGVFLANEVTIAFVNSLLQAGKQTAILIDTKENPIEIESLHDFLELLVGHYVESTNEYKIQVDKLKRAKNIKKIMDW
jgi:hypothetical protein